MVLETKAMIIRMLPSTLFSLTQYSYNCSQHHSHAKLANISGVLIHVFLNYMFKNTIYVIIFYILL